MNARQLRRAQERKERKLARKSEQQNAATVSEARVTANRINAEDEAAVLSEPKTQRRLAANRANSLLSTGPRTPEGKAISSLNSLKTGLTGRTVLLPADDVAAYEAHCLRLHNKWNPEGEDESLLVQSIADTEWRLRRIPLLEFAIYAKGRTDEPAVLSAAKITDEVVAQAADSAAPSDPALIDLETFLRYEKQLRNLTLQEGRLNRQRDKQIAELRQLQSERLARHADQQSEAACAAAAPRATNNGFVFSTAGIEHLLDPVPAANTTHQSTEFGPNHAIGASLAA